MCDDVELDSGSELDVEAEIETEPPFVADDLPSPDEQKK